MTIDANQPPTGSSVGNVVRRVAGAHIGRVPIGGLVAAVAVATLLGTAYYLGNPSVAGSGGLGSNQRALSAEGAPAIGTVSGDSTGAFKAAAPGSFGGDSGPTAAATPGDQLTAGLETTQIVKTGSMALEVSDLNKAVSQAQSTIVGMGGDVSQSSSAGDKTAAVATVTYRVPVAKWDDALLAMRGLASRVISEQTNSTDVTAQVIDVEARLNNLNATESALQSIMARATAISDVLAVEQQLSQTQGQIEQLTAQRDHLKNQAAMSTLSVSFSTPAATVTTQTAQGWDLGAQGDEAGGQLVRIGQGLATIAVWTVVVGFPIVIGLAFLGGIWWIVRRIARRRRHVTATA